MPPWVYESLSAFDGTVKNWLEMTINLKVKIEDINAQICIAIEDLRFGHKPIDSEWLSKARGVTPKEISAKPAEVVGK